MFLSFLSQNVSESRKIIPIFWVTGGTEESIFTSNSYSVAIVTSSVVSLVPQAPSPHTPQAAEMVLLDIALPVHSQTF
jgi:hypothetical protein